MAGVLLLITGVTHLSQLFFTKAGNVTLVASLGGILFLLLGFFILRGSRLAIWLAVANCSLGFLAGFGAIVHGDIVALPSSRRYDPGGSR